MSAGNNNLQCTLQYVFYALCTLLLVSRAESSQDLLCFPKIYFVIVVTASIAVLVSITVLLLPCICYCAWTCYMQRTEEVKSSDNPTSTTNPHILPESTKLKIKNLGFEMHDELVKKLPRPDEEVEMPCIECILRLDQLMLTIYYSAELPEKVPPANVSQHLVENDGPDSSTTSSHRILENVPQKYHSTINSYCSSLTKDPDILKCPSTSRASSVSAQDGVPEIPTSA